MLNFAANLSFLFPSHPFLDRFSASAEAGFKGCEYLFPYQFDANEIATQLHACGLTQVLFNIFPGDWEAGERGLASLPGREAEFASSVDLAVRYAEALGCKRLHVMAGCANADGQRCKDVFLSNIDFAAKRCLNAGITALIEPINPIDMPGYYLTDLDQALEIINTVGAPNLKLQFDCYHRAMVGKDVIGGLERSVDHLGHVQIAGVPGRNEPGTGMLAYDPIFQKLIDLNYDGWIGCEYRPAGKTRDGLGWIEPWIS